MIRIKNPTPARLPSEYQEVEYLESTASQCINTGIPLNQYRKCEMQFTPTQLGTLQIIDGGYVDINSQPDTRNYLRIDTDGTLNIQYARSNTSYKLSSIKVTAGTKYTVKYEMLASSCSLTVNGTAYSVANGVTLITNGYNVFLFGQSFKSTDSSTTYEASAYIKLYSAKYYDVNDTLIRDFVPCYRKSDNEPGMYDLVNGTFYTNAGSGTFLIGNEVNKRDININPMIGSTPLLRRYVQGKLVYGEEPSNYEQLVNYTMLYDGGDECTSVVGGWSGTTYYTSATVIKYSEYIHIHSYRATAYTQSKVNLTGYSKMLLVTNTRGRTTTSYNSQFIHVADSVRTTTGYINSTRNNILVANVNISAGANYNFLVDIPSAYQTSKYIGVMSDDSGYLAYINMYNFAIFKADDWETLASLSDITASSIDDILTNSETLLSSKEAVEFMLKQCTGDFMANAVVNQTFLTALKNSAYNTTIHANEHWNKFLSMVA